MSISILMTHHTYSNATKTNFFSKRISHWNDWRISKFWSSKPIYYLVIIPKFMDSNSTSPYGPDRYDVTDSVIWRFELNGRNWFYLKSFENYSPGIDSKITKFSDPRTCTVASLLRPLVVRSKTFDYVNFMNGNRNKESVMILVEN